nr:UDP-N-acetylmuramate--L-alanine ligase [Lachnospiraceae bacterium]
ARNYPHKKIWCVFQPHTYTRTSKLFDRFADVLAQADEVLLAPIYAARETDTLGVSSDKLAEAVRARGTKASSYPCFEQIEDYLREHAQEGDLILTVGAGDVTQVGSDLAKKAQG